MNRYSPIFISLGLVALTLAAFFPVLSAQFVNIDDPAYVVLNPHIRDGLSLADMGWAWSSFHAGFYIPVTWLSLQLDGTLFGPAAIGFHRTNLCFHLANAVILFWILYRQIEVSNREEPVPGRATGALGRSALIAGLFAVHPQHVESVAWISERKDVLFTFFGLLALACYLRYASGPRRTFPGPYLLMLACYTLSLLAKPMLVTFPVLLLIVDWVERWAKTGFAWLALEKTPLFLLAGVAGLLTLEAQTLASAILPATPAERIVHAVMGYESYLARTFWPFDLGVFYQYPAGGFSASQVLRASLILGSISILAFLGRGRYPWVWTGWLWFVVGMLPVCGLIQSGEQYTADRFTYWPHIGLFLGLVELASSLGDRWHVPWKAQAILGLGLLLLLALRTFDQARTWHDSRTLWEQAVRAGRPNAHATAVLAGYLHGHGLELMKLGKNDEALECLRRAHALLDNLHEPEGLSEGLRASVDLARARNPHDIGVLLGRMGDWQGAKIQFERAVHDNPDNPAFKASLDAARQR